MVCFAPVVSHETDTFPYAPPVSLTFRVCETVRIYSTPTPTPVPNPFDDCDALEELEEEIVILAAHIHSADHRLLTLVAEFDRRRGWELGGHRSCAHWLAFSTGIDLGAAREKVRAARALVELPRIGAAMSKGELSFSAVRALTRVATAENERDLLELARGCTAAQLERVVRAYKRGSRKDEAAQERERYDSRALSVFPDDDGMYVVKGKLTPEVGALLMRAVEAADDALFREKGYRNVSHESSRKESAQRRADALGLMAERALAAGFGAVPERGEGGEEAEADDETGSEARAPLSGTRAERYQVMLHVDSDTLTAEGEPGRSELEDGTRVAAETSRRLTCDAAFVAVSHAPDGSVAGAGRRTRTISPALRRALEARDRGCRFKGCGLRFTDAHHVKHWADGGETSLGNLLLLCAHHHRLVHEEGWKVEWWGRERLPAFIDPRGQVSFNAGWKAPELPADPVASLIAENTRRGVEPDYYTAGARWKTEWDIPNHVYLNALEALA